MSSDSLNIDLFYKLMCNALHFNEKVTKLHVKDIDNQGLWYTLLDNIIRLRDAWRNENKRQKENY